MPPKSKPKNAATQHDKRHDTGLAPPGRRVTKQRSNGHLNGQPNGSSTGPSASAVPPLPSTGLNQAFRFPRPGDAAATLPGDEAPPSAEHAGPHEDMRRRGRISSDVSLDDIGPRGEMGDRLQTHGPELGTTMLNGEALPSASRAGAVPNGAAPLMAPVSTILTYYPLRDAISILILLLSLPPTLVLVIQTLFATLTFVPPTAGLSLSTFPNLKEMFNSAGMGYPALATIVSVDLIFWICWLPIWTPLQGMFLDLSQAVIAVSLSGAAASTGQPTYSIATTSIIVCVVHVLRYRAIHLTALDYLRSVIHKMGLGSSAVVPSVVMTPFISTSPIERGWIHTVIRTILGIHIVSQGVTTCIRRSLVKANEQNSNPPAITKSDPEAGTGSEAINRPLAGLNEAGPHSTSSPILDGRSTVPTTPRDGKSREPNSKKKRKQANQVRSQQPLWAAIASTKVTFIKEMEQRDAAEDAREAAYMDTDMGLSPVATISVTNRIWIREVRDTEICFSVELAPTSEATAEESANAGAEPTRPFYVCINGAAWSSTRIAPHIGDSEAGDRKSQRFEGEIFGLAPLSGYHCEVVSQASKKVLCGTSIITQATPSAEQTVAPSSQTAQTLRPSSPVTMLKQSILTADAKLNEIRSRGKKSKKDQRAVHSDIKREINILRSKVESSGGTDDKQERRLIQITQHKNQAEEAAAEIKEQVDALGELPPDEVAAADAQRRLWQASLDSKTSAQQELDDAKAEGEREMSALKSDIYHAESKREKLLARHAQRTQDMEKLVSKQHADMTAKQRRDFERAQVMQAREAEEQQLRFHIANFEADSQAMQQKAHDAYQQIATLQSWPAHGSQQQQPPPYPGLSSPPTPENQILAANGSAIASPPPPNGFPMFSPQQQAAFLSSPHFHSAAAATGNPARPFRGRSSSMLSQYSGFTDDGDDNTNDLAFASEPRGPPQSHAPYSQQQQQQQTSPWSPYGTAGGPISLGPGAAEGLTNLSDAGSGSLTGGSTGSNSPRPDAKPFLPAAGKGSAPVVRANGREKMPQSPLQTSASAGMVDGES